MRYLLSEIAGITGGRLMGEDRLCVHPMTDSRRASRAQGTIFMAIKGERHDGHRYLDDVAAKGIRAFLLSDARRLPQGSSGVVVEDSLRALQDLASHHRASFTGTMVAITGSAGKTVVKEMAYRALSGRFQTYRSPASYNSQLGVALSLLGLEPHHELALIEAGISEKGEMARLAEMIRPDIGLLTSLGPAHDAGFVDREEKVREKSVLFDSCERIIYGEDDELVSRVFAERFGSQRLIAWGSKPDAQSHLIDVRQVNGQQHLTYCTGGRSHELSFPTTDAFGVTNAMLLTLLLELLGLTPSEVADRVFESMRVSSHLEMTHCRWGSSMLMDQSSLDPASLKLAMDALQLHAQARPQVIVLTADPLRGLRNEARLKGMRETLDLFDPAAVHLVGEPLEDLASTLPASHWHRSVGEFRQTVDKEDFSHKAILLKGAWSPDFSAIRDRLMESGHSTVMSVDLEAMVHNLNAFRARLDPDVQLMVMVKAFSYGSGDAEVAQLLAYHGVDRLAVAYTDEGVALREKGIELPIMVMNWGADDRDNLLEYRLEPEVYSHTGLHLLEELISQDDGLRISIHLKVDTGMHRLGFEPADLSGVWEKIQRFDRLNVVSVFTHLLASDDPAQEEKTIEQLDLFTELKSGIREKGGAEVLFHALNTGGILRYPAHQHEMVRLGIGLYGHSPVSDEVELESVLSLRTVISQIREVSAGETVGYGGQMILDRDHRIAVLPIGYADGLSRRLGNGVGSVFVGASEARYIGNICMDMAMVDVTDIDCEEGDEVEVIGEQKRLEVVAREMGTIPYEVLVGVSARVRRRWLG